MATNNSIDSVNGVKVGGIHTLGTQANVTPTTWNLPANSATTSTLMNASLTNIDPGGNFISTITQVSFFHLSGAASAVVATASPASRYRIKILRLGDILQPFGGGDRNIDIRTSPALIYSSIPSAFLLGSPNYTVYWGEAGLPRRTGPWSTQTSFGLNLVAIYSGGTTDYTAGSVEVEVMWEKVV